MSHGNTKKLILPAHRRMTRLSWLNAKMEYLRMVTHLCTNLARRRVTLLKRPMTLPLSQTATELSNNNNNNNTFVERHSAVASEALLFGM